MATMPSTSNSFENSRKRISDCPSSGSRTPAVKLVMSVSTRTRGFSAAEDAVVNASNRRTRWNTLSTYQVHKTPSCAQRAGYQLVPADSLRLAAIKGSPSAWDDVGAEREGSGHESSAVTLMPTPARCGMRYTLSAPIARSPEAFHPHAGSTCRVHPAITWPPRFLAMLGR